MGLRLQLCAAWLLVPVLVAAAAAAVAVAADSPEVLPRLTVPVVGVRNADLRDSFEDGRPGHRHQAIDIPAPIGTPVVAAIDGRLAKLFASVPGGLTIYEFDSFGRYAYYYAHLQRYADGVVEGMALKRGQLIGYVGTTGNAPKNAPHLHFAIFRLGPEKHWWEGEAVNPYPALRDAETALTPPSPAPTPPAATAPR